MCSACVQFGMPPSGQPHWQNKLDLTKVYINMSLYLPLSLSIYLSIDTICTHIYIYMYVQRVCVCDTLVALLILIIIRPVKPLCVQRQTTRQQPAGSRFPARELVEPIHSSSRRSHSHPVTQVAPPGSTCSSS